MFLGLLFIILTGIQWGMVNVTMSKARHAVKDVTPFYVIGGLTTFVLIGLGHLLFGIQLLPAVFSWKPVLYIVMASVASAGANSCIIYTMGFGASALYLALSSMGFAVSFLWTVLWLKEPLSLLNALGLLSLCAAVMLAAIAKQGDAKGSNASSSKGLVFKRLLVAALSTCCGGTQHIGLILAGREGNMPAMGKTMLIMVTYIVVFAIVCFLRRVELPKDKKLLLRPSICWGMLALTSYVTFFLAIKHLTEAGRSGISFPVGAGTQMVAFTLYAWIFLKEKLNWKQILAMLLIVIGIVAVRG